MDDLYWLLIIVKDLIVILNIKYWNMTRFEIFFFVLFWIISYYYVSIVCIYLEILLVICM